MTDLLKQAEDELARCQLLRQKVLNEGLPAEVEKLDIAIEGYEMSIRLIKEMI